MFMCLFILKLKKIEHSMRIKAHHLVSNTMDTIFEQIISRTKIKLEYIIKFVICTIHNYRVWLCSHTKIKLEYVIKFVISIIHNSQSGYV